MAACSKLHLGPANFCANCDSKMSKLEWTPEAGGVWRTVHGLSGAGCMGPCCQAKKFSRCARCHVVSYCSKDCQLEHWKSHKKICKKLTRGSADDQSDFIKYVFYNMYNIKKETVLTLRLSFPFDLKERHGWIDEYLVCLYDIIHSLSGGDITQFKGIRSHLANLRGVYLTYLSMEKDSKLTEYAFSLSFRVYGYLELAGSFGELAESFMKTELSGANGVLQESFIYVLADLIRNLRMVKYKFINLKSAKKKKHGSKYRALKPFYVHGLKMLEDVGVKKNQDGRYESRTREILPPNAQCVGCTADLGGEEAQLLLPPPGGDIWKGDFNILRVADTPCVLEMDSTSRHIIACGKNPSCTTEAKRVYRDYLIKESNALLDFLIKTRVCYGCSMHSMRTHRCSRCRKARYCSQNCLNRDWVEHQVRCRDFTRPGSRDLYQSKRLEGEALSSYTRECANRVHSYDFVIDGAVKSLTVQDRDV